MYETLNGKSNMYKIFKNTKETIPLKATPRNS